MDQKVVLITGTSSGFGKYIAQTMAKAGYIVVATMRNTGSKNKISAEDLIQWAKNEEVELSVMELDVTSDTQVEKVINEILAVEGRIDILVNNAGIAAMGYGETYSNRQLQQLFDVNVIGSNRLIKNSVPVMRRQKSGLIIQISSLAASLPMPYHGNYPATKIAIETIVESYKYELAPFGIDVAIIQPGGFPTSLIDNALKPEDINTLEEYGQLADIPEKIFAGSAQALSSPDAPNPQAVADAVLELANKEYGNRPLKTIVDKMGIEPVLNAAESINTHAEKIKTALMKTMGFA